MIDSGTFQEVEVHRTLWREPDDRLKSNGPYVRAALMSLWMSAMLMV